MPTTTIGLFDSFDNLDQIPAEAISSWLKPVPQPAYVANYLANKILYPKSFPVSKQDMQIDLAILREALKMNGPKRPQQVSTLLGDNSFLNITLRKILIPIRFLAFIPDLASLVMVFIDALLLNRTKEDWFQDIWTIVLTDTNDEIIGSVIMPQFENKDSLMVCQVFGKNYEIRPGNLAVLPCNKSRCEIGYKLNKGKILGKEENAVEVYGGKLGLVIDGRNI